MPYYAKKESVIEALRYDKGLKLLRMSAHLSDLIEEKREKLHATKDTSAAKMLVDDIAFMTERRMEFTAMVKFRLLELYGIKLTGADANTLFYYNVADTLTEIEKGE